MILSSSYILPTILADIQAFLHHQVQLLFLNSSLARPTLPLYEGNPPSIKYYPTPPYKQL